MLSQPGSGRAIFVSLLLPRRLRQRKDTESGGWVRLESCCVETGLAGAVGYYPGSHLEWPTSSLGLRAFPAAILQVNRSKGALSTPLLLSSSFCGQWGNIWCIELTVTSLMGPEVGLM